MLTPARLVSINTSNGGVPKLPVAAATRVHVAPSGVAGDRQGDRRHHGGPERAVCLYSAELIAALRAEGHSPEAGSLGENLTLSGVDWARMTAGTRVRVGAVTLELTGPAAPCSKLTAYFTGGDFNRVAEKQHPGWSRMCARVLVDGPVQVGDAVAILP
jgi:MOSC domain-containing protein YiiM